MTIIDNFVDYLQKKSTKKEVKRLNNQEKLRVKFYDETNKNIESWREK